MRPWPTLAGNDHRITCGHQDHVTVAMEEQVHPEKLNGDRGGEVISTLRSHFSVQEIFLQIWMMPSLRIFYMLVKQLSLPPNSQRKSWTS
jgi:hypothetical protein